MVVDFPMDAVAGARRTPERLKTGGVSPKPPATILLSLWPSVFLGLRIVVQDVAGSLLTRCCGSRIFVHIAAATSALCRGTSQQNIAFQMFLQIQTLRRQVSRPVAAGVSPSPQDVAAPQYVCSGGADNLTFRRPLASRCHWLRQVVAATSCALWTAGLGRSFFLPSSTVASVFYESAGERPSPSGGCWSALSGGQEAEGR